MGGKLYIVSGKKTAPEADWLEARIDGGATAAAGEGSERWTVREYLTGAEGLGGDDALVFVGAADAWAHETEGGEAVFDRFGIRCAVRGRRALLTAAEGPIAAKKDKNAVKRLYWKSILELEKSGPSVAEARNTAASPARRRK